MTEKFYYINTDNCPDLPVEAVILSDNYYARTALSQKGRTVYSTSDILSAGDYSGARERVSAYLLDWLKNNVLPDESGLGINMYEFSLLEFTNDLLALMHCEIAFNRLAKEHNFDSIGIVTADENEAFLFRELAAKYKMRYAEKIVREKGGPAPADFKDAIKSLSSLFLVPLANLAVCVRRFFKTKKAGRILICSGLRGTFTLIQDLNVKYDIYAYHQQVQIKKTVLYMNNDVTQLIAEPGVPRIRKQYPDVALKDPGSRNEFCAFKAFDNIVIKSRPEYFGFGNSAVSLFSRLLKKKRIDMVVVEEDVSRPMKSLAMVSRILGIKVVQINHSIPCALVPKTRVYPSYSDYIMVGGPRTKEVFADYFSLEKDRLVITGSPKYDGASLKSASSIQRFYSEYGIRPDKKIVLILLCWILKKGGFRNNFEMLQANKKFFDDLSVFNHQYGSGYYFLIKLHPNDQNRHFLSDWTPGKFANMKIFQHYDIDLLLDASHLVLAHWSNACMDTVMRDKGLFIIDYGKKADVYNFREYGVSKITDYESLEKALLSSSDHESAPDLGKMQQDYEFFRDGNAAGRISRFIDEVLEQKKAHKKWILTDECK